MSIRFLSPAGALLSHKIPVMPNHPVFTDLLLYSDDELERLLGARPAERRVIQAWPLSCVEEVRLADGRRLVYKAQLPPSVEPEFYAAADSVLLPAHRDLGRLGRVRMMALDWIAAPLLSQTEHDADGLVAHARKVIALIGEIGGEPPSYLDVGSPGAWSEAVDRLLGRWSGLLARGRLAGTGPDDLDHVRAWAASAPVQALLEDGSRLAHGDLKADQIFVTPDGYRLIDWQRPILAPPEVDLVSLLVAAGIDPHPFVDPTTVAVHWLLRLNWAVEAQSELFPDQVLPLLGAWAHEAVGHIRDISASPGRPR